MAWIPMIPEMEPEDVDALRTAGLEDSEILDAAQVTAYYAFANRLADGLGVELGGFWSAMNGGRAV